MMPRRLVEAEKYLVESGDSIANGPDNDAAIELVQNLKELGCKVRAELEKSFNQEDFNGTLFITLPKQITAELIVLIAGSRPDEVSEDEENLLRVWWD